MKLALVSDTHGRWEDLGVEIAKGDYQGLIHLGDYVDDAKALAGYLGLPLYYVGGNGDFFEPKKEGVLSLSGKKIFLTHGHKYDVHQGIDKLYYKALEVGARVVLFGHTHVPLVLWEDNILFINPGSPSRPRDQRWGPTYGVLEMKDGKCQGKIIQFPNKKG